MSVRATLDAHDPDLNARTCRRCGRTFEVLERATAAGTFDALTCEARAGVIDPSDTGLGGAIPLVLECPPWAPLDDAAWSAQNRKINDLLMGRAG